MAGSVAKAQIGMRLRIRPIRAKYQHVNAEHTKYGVDSTVAVAGYVNERARIGHTPRQRTGAAARGKALAMQRRETCQRSKADPQPRIGRPAVSAEREPCRVQLLNIGDDGGPPRRGTRLHPRRGPRVDEQREAPLGEHVKQRAAPAIARLVSDCGCWQLKPGKPAVQLLDEASRVDCRQTGRGPADERGAQPSNPIVVSVKKRLPILRHQVLNAKRA